MVMIQDGQTGKVLVQDRVKSWKGLSFPGGHIEDGESIVDSAIREVKEETGLDVRNLKSCGIIHWLNSKTFDRYLVFLFKTRDYSGELVAECDEGRNSWITLDELRDTPSENQTPRYLPMFLEGIYSEAFGYWSDDEPWEIIYK
jgi:8-oxo-dGTP diphosphatase